jgi:hypothetical protein
MTSDQEILVLKTLQDSNTALQRINANIERLFFLLYQVNAPTGVGVGRVDNIQTNTPKRLNPTPLPCIGIVVSADEENEGDIAYGNELVHVDALSDDCIGVRLSKGESSPMLPINDVSKIWIDAIVSGDGASYVYFYKTYEDKDAILNALSR